MGQKKLYPELQKQLDKAGKMLEDEWKKMGEEVASALSVETLSKAWEKLHVPSFTGNSYVKPMTATQLCNSTPTSGAFFESPAKKKSLKVWSKIERYMLSGEITGFRLYYDTGYAEKGHPVWRIILDAKIAGKFWSMDYYVDPKYVKDIDGAKGISIQQMYAIVLKKFEKAREDAKNAKPDSGPAGSVPDVPF